MVAPESPPEEEGAKHQRLPPVSEMPTSACCGRSRLSLGQEPWSHTATWGAGGGSPECHEDTETQRGQLPGTRVQGPLLLSPVDHRVKGPRHTAWLLPSESLALARSCTGQTQGSAPRRRAQSGSECWALTCWRRAGLTRSGEPCRVGAGAREPTLTGSFGHHVQVGHRVVVPNQWKLLQGTLALSGATLVVTTRSAPGLERGRPGMLLHLLQCWGWPAREPLVPQGHRAEGRPWCLGSRNRSQEIRKAGAWGAIETGPRGRPGPESRPSCATGLCCSPLRASASPLQSGHTGPSLPARSV
ncbi:uncharacterized protein ACOB7L_003308 [Callospermophilus lateralis]